MSKCKICGNDIESVSELRHEYSEQADQLGMESLTENEQLLVSGVICEECFDDLD